MKKETSDVIRYPRLVIAGLAGDSGKTLASLGVIGALRARGIEIAAFKKGPDFIDAAWLEAASGRPARNLDTFLMPREAILNSVATQSSTSALGVVEGNRGLFDGMTAEGTHSTAELAKLLDSPVILVIDSSKVTRTVAAMVKGCAALDPDLPLAGVILNQVATLRQERLIRTAVEKEAGVPVIGAIPRIRDQLLPGRHLGLVTAAERPERSEVIERAASVVAASVDLEAILKVAGRAPFLRLPHARSVKQDVSRKDRVHLGVLRDEAFSFYYPENLESLEAAGAVLVAISPLADTELPEIEGLYAGGGFPEVYGEALSANRSFRRALRKRISDGMPVWAECGGLMYLSEALQLKGKSFPMVGALPVKTVQTERPQGHGYVRATVDRKNPFFDGGTRLVGHEFHYSRLVSGGEVPETVLRLERGTGVGDGRDGLMQGRIVASYTHLHALGSPEWAEALVNAALGVQS